MKKAAKDLLIFLCIPFLAGVSCALVISYIKDNRKITGTHMVILEHLCKKNDGIDYFKIFNDNYDVKCRDGAQFLDVTINLKDTEAAK